MDDPVDLSGGHKAIAAERYLLDCATSTFGCSGEDMSTRAKDRMKQDQYTC